MKKVRLAVIFHVVIILFIICAGLYFGNQLSGHSASEIEIALLFDKWNQALKTGDPRQVTSLYANHSILLPTLSDKIRVTLDEKEEYFSLFLKKEPSARIDFRQIEIGKNMAVDSGIYTFTFAKTGEKVQGRYSYVYKWDGKRWLIASHHSSLMPEGKQNK